ncbi:MAG: hypothetical protein J2P23_04285 [Microlunatus sp.]|nr:hypothetical protein [Microlunatus sp.]
MDPDHDHHRPRRPRRAADTTCPPWCTSHDRDGDDDPREIRHSATVGGWLEVVRWDATDAASDVSIGIDVDALEDRLGMGGRNLTSGRAEAVGLAGELITAAVMVEPLDADALRDLLGRMLADGQQAADVVDRINGSRA